MSTRSRIAIERADGSVTSIYCHFDGYLDGAGQTLVRHWSEQEQVEALIALGDISALNEEIGEKHDFDFSSTFHAKYRDKGGYDAMCDDPAFQRLKRMVNAYGRDRGEDAPAMEHADAAAYLETDTGTEYWYLFRAGHWFYCDNPADATWHSVLAEQHVRAA